MKSTFLKNALTGIALAAVSLGVTLLVVEILIRIFLPDFRYDPSKFKYEIWPADYQTTLHPNTRLIPGITGPGLVKTNRYGLRGAPFSTEDKFEIVAIGGSTTECLYLDQTETWPRLLENHLNDSLPGYSFWIGNGGKSATTTRHHILQMENAIDQYPDVDLILMLIGVNDLAKRLARGAAYETEKPSTPREELVQFSRAFKRHPRQVYPFYNKLGLWRVCAKFWKRVKLYFSDTRQDLEGEAFDRWRKYRLANSNKVEELPDLAGALKNYIRNIETIISLAKERKIPIVFASQPSIWKKDLGSYMDSLLWLGGIGMYQGGKGTGYYSVEALARGMKLYNDALMNTCTEHGIHCLDLAELIPRDTSAFFDDVHFNEQGARMVADKLSEFLQKTIPGLLKNPPP